MNRRLLVALTALLPALAGCERPVAPVKTETSTPAQTTHATNAPATSATLQKIVVGGGCFWCVEAVFQRLPGVKKVVSGYSGGHLPNPTYEQISTKTTGHAEVIAVEFEPAQVTVDRVLDVFFVSHDPTTPNRQGADTGPQYRSCIFYADATQRAAAQAAAKRNQSEWRNPIVTEIAPLKEFYPAEDYHQNYYNLNADRNPYCSVVIAPKLHKLVQQGIIRRQ